MMRVSTIFADFEVISDMSGFLEESVVVTVKCFKEFGGGVVH